MRCSSCEIDLDRYVEGTLTPRRMAAVSAHLQRCDGCTQLLGELRVVDALLATTASAPLAPNFTFAVMAEVRSLPVESRRRTSVWAVLSFYVIAAWFALTGVALDSGGRIPWLAPIVGNVRAALGDTFATVAGAAHGIAPATPLVVGGVIAILAMDLMLAVAIFFSYRTIRPRLAARLARSESV